MGLASFRAGLAARSRSAPAPSRPCPWSRAQPGHTSLNPSAFRNLRVVLLAADGDRSLGGPFHAGLKRVCFMGVISLKGFSNICHFSQIFPTLLAKGGCSSIRSFQL